MTRAGDELGGYVLVRQLGSGGMGTVYEAIDADRRHVALKLLHPHVGADPVARERLRREVATLHRVRHTGVARVLDAEADSDEAFVVTELVDGQTLEESVREHGTFQPDELASLAQGLSDGLRAIHTAGVVHRDVKPSNVMLTDDGPVLIDFGISQILDDTRHTVTGMVTGTPGYIDPQVVAGGPPSQEGDWWAWAAVLVFAVTGRAPFGRGPMPAVMARLTQGDVDVAGLAPDLARAFSSALAPALDERTTPEDLLRVLHARVDGPPAPTADPTAVVPTPGRDGPATTVVDPTRPGGVPGPGVPVPGGPAPGAPAGGTRGGPVTRVLPTVAPSYTPGVPPGPPLPPTPTVRLPLLGASRPPGTAPGPPPPPPRSAAPTRANPYAPPPGQAAPGQAPLGQAAPGQALPGRALPGKALPGQALPGQPWRPAGPGERSGPPTWRGAGAVAPVPPPGQPPAAGFGGPVGPPGAWPAGVQELPVWARPAAPRPGLVAGLAAVVVSLVMVWPGSVAVGAGVALALAAAVGSAARATRSRRLRAGRRVSDVTVAVLASPWHVLRGAVAVAVSLLAGLLVGLAAWWIVWMLLAGPDIAIDEASASTKALVTGAVAALVLAVTWLAPTNGLAREGLRTAAALAVRGPGATRGVVLAALAVALVVVALALAGGQAPDWAPFGVPPYG